MQTTLTFYVNGKKIVEEKPDPEWTLAYYLRNKLLLKGTKVSCGEGQCGSCSVMLSKYDNAKKCIKHMCINACLAPMVSLHGCAVTTVEGVGSVQKGLHPVQERLAKRHGAQCGYCSPGFVMSMYTLLRKNNPNPSKEDVELALEGNLCRCTGYRPILEAFYSFDDSKCPCGFQGECCQSESGESTQCKPSPISSWSHLRLYDPSQDPIFPPELVGWKCEDLCYKGVRVTWYSPTNLKTVFDLMLKYPQAKVIGTGALTGLQERLSNEPHQILISISNVSELKQITPSDKELIIGAGLTISEFQNGLKDFGKTHDSPVVKLLLHTFPVIGYEQLRNFVSWVGNVASGWFISDISLCLLVSQSCLKVQSSDGKERTVPVDNNFFVGHWKVNLAPNEFITGVVIPLRKVFEIVTPNSKCITIMCQKMLKDPADILYEYFSVKQGQRHGHDSAIINAACGFTIDKKNMVLKEIRLAFGGLANRPYMVFLKEDVDLKNNNSAISQTIMKKVENELEKVIDKSLGRNEYRITLSLSFVYKFISALQQKLTNQKPTLMDQPKFEEVKGVQIVPEVVSGQPPADPVGRPMMHNAIQKHVTGESSYCDDVPSQPNECHMALVLSERAHAKIVSIDPSVALALPGVVGWIGAADLPDKCSNTPGRSAMFDIDIAIFAVDKVECHGETVGAVLAEDPLLARRAAKLVKIVYEDLPAVTTIDEAIKQNQVCQPVFKEVKGDADLQFSNCECVLSGEARLRQQEHFYMETQCCVIIPKDGDEYEIYSSTQCPSWIQMQAAAAIGVPANKIICKVKRIGGGFGGKNEQAAFALWPAIVAARKFQRPVRHVLTRSEDMTVTGKRPAFLAKYTVGFNKSGDIKALQVSVNVDAGRKANFCSFITLHCLENMDSGYNFSNMTAEGITLRTNNPNNTMMRGAGQPEGHFITECILESVAQHLKIDAVEIRRKHLYKDGDFTMHHVKVEDCTMEKCWEQCLQMSQYNLRKAEVEKFNKENRFRKRGITMITSKTGIGMLDTPFEQGGVLVNIYLDGSVQISHGGVEMGQGLNTKLIQIASRVLKIPFENISTYETGTDKVPNGMPTGGSIGTDVYGPAVKEACETLLQRLEPYIAKNPKGNLVEWVMAAHAERVQLSATGFCRPFGDNPDGKRTNKPRYFVYGVVCTEVEIDCLTGDHFAVQSDLVLDVGQTLNPALDVGQVEGAFLQGYGMVTMEEMLYASDGKLITNSAASYKIPNINTVPKKFRIAFLKDSVCRGNIYSSKGIGEPPLTLGASAYFAIVNAVKAARHEVGLTEPFVIESPATPEKIRLMCPKIN